MEFEQPPTSTAMPVVRAKQKPIVSITTYLASRKPQVGNILASAPDENGSAPQEALPFDSYESDRLQKYPLEYSKVSPTSSTRNYANMIATINRLIIKGPGGSVRGRKDTVRVRVENLLVASHQSQWSRNFALNHLPTFCNHSDVTRKLMSAYFGAALPLSTKWTPEMQESYSKHFEVIESDRCVIYTTSLGVLRRTFEDSKRMRAILNLNLIRHEERDIYLNEEFKFQFRLRCPNLQVPSLYLDGRLFGGIKELEQLNETGELKNHFKRFILAEPDCRVCQCCGNARFIACQSCNGSRKSSVHHFKSNSVILRCIKCDKNNGLIECPSCKLD